MTLVAVPPLVWPGWPAALGFGVDLIDAVGDKDANVFRAPKTGNVDRVAFRTATVTTGGNLRISVQTVDSTTGHPTGTLVTSGAEVTRNVLSSEDDTWIEVTLGTAAALVVGTEYAVVFEIPAASAFNGNLALLSLHQTTGAFPYIDLFDAAAWFRWHSPVPMAIRYTDGTYPMIPGMIAAKSAAATANVNTGTTPDEIGNKFSLPMSCRLAGVQLPLAVYPNNADFTVKLYDATDTVLRSTAFDATYGAASGGTTSLFPWITFDPIVLEAGAIYRLTLLPTTANSLQARYTELASAALMETMFGQTTHIFEWTQRTDAGAWTATALRLMNMELMIDQIDNGQTPHAYGYVG